MQRLLMCLLLGTQAGICHAQVTDSNRLTYLDESNVYAPGLAFPKLVTPQWVNEDGVDAVIVLAIDDMRQSEKYETYLRPILQRLKQIDGRAPVSIMSCRAEPEDTRIRQWLEEGLSIEVHTVDHPCPLLKDGNFDEAIGTYHRCIDQMHDLPGNRPVAFRTPCCDSLNTVSPRFFAEMFTRPTARGHRLHIDSSVFNFFTSNDPAIPRELIIDDDGQDRFLKYMPKGRGFVNFVRDYPYPWLINGTCWEFPCLAPSDWSAQHRQGVNHPLTLADWKAAVDITVIKQGVLNLVFHPHGWIRNDQVVELIDHAVTQHGTRVKFLTFREALQRLRDSGLAHADTLNRNSVGNPFVLDINNDGYMDAITTSTDPNGKLTSRTRLWNPAGRNWIETNAPDVLPLVDQPTIAAAKTATDTSRKPTNEIPPKSIASSVVRFGVLHDRGFASMLICRSKAGIAHPEVWQFDGTQWGLDSQATTAIRANHGLGITICGAGVRLRDIDGNGQCEIIVNHEQRPSNSVAGSAASSVQRILARSGTEWTARDNVFPSDCVLEFAADDGLTAVDNGVRFIDLDEDGHDDIVLSNHERYAVWLFDPEQRAWNIPLLAGERLSQIDAAADAGPAGETLPQSPGVIPAIVDAAGHDYGFFTHQHALHWQNEHTSARPHLVDARTFHQLLGERLAQSKTPDASRNAMTVRDGFRVELVADEPLIRDPVAFDWAADGSLWVVEMHDYPNGVPAANRKYNATRSDDDAESPLLRPGGRVRILRDSQPHDGIVRYDTATTFLDDLPFPNGIMLWRNGALISAVPNIIYAEDTNGDGQADLQEIVYSGFAEGNQQHRANGFAWSLDGWIHVANGDSGGRIQSIRSGQDLDISGRDLRIDPDTGQLETVSGRSQFGRNRDDHGNWFGCNNSNPMWHFVLDDAYIRRNPHIAVPDPRRDVPEVAGNAPIFPVSRTLERFNDFHTANRFTSACSTMVYRGDQFGHHFRGNAFTCEPVHNLINRSVLTPDGVSFKGRRAVDEQDREFLASRDNWSRPVFVRTGPDGALWFADMYRQVIEHPEWIPADWQQRLDVRAGSELGRIYRVVRIASDTDTDTDPGTVAESQTNPIGFANVTPLELLGSANGLLRDKAHQQLLHEANPNGIPDLMSLLLTHSRAETRLHALCLLDSLTALKDELLVRALDDRHAAVRRHAARIAERFASMSVPVRSAMLRLARDPDATVRMQVGCSLGVLTGPEVDAALATLLMTDADDESIRAAAMTSLRTDNLSSVVQQLMLQNAEERVSSLVIKPLAGMAAATKNQAALQTLLSHAIDPRQADHSTFSHAATVVADVTAELTRHRMSLAELLDDQSSLVNPLTQLIDRAMRVAGETDQPVPGRIAAVRLLGTIAGNSPDLVDRFDRLTGSLLSPNESIELQAALIDVLSSANSEATPRLLLEHWPGLSTAVRNKILSVLLNRPAWTTSLLNAIEHGIPTASEIDASTRQRLLTHRNPEMKQRAADLFTERIDANRQAVIESMSAVLQQPGSAAGGAVVFRKRCATCHRIGDVGHVVGPDLTSLTNKSSESLLTAILDPNRAVEAKFVGFTVITDDGLTHAGMIQTETGNSITLIGAEAKLDVVLRSRIEEFASTNKSLMPEGLEKDVSVTELADVLAFVRSASAAMAGAQTRKSFSGNAPELIRPTIDDLLRMPVSRGGILGPSLIFESHWGNVNNWNHASDRIEWDVEVAHAGRYMLRMRYAQPDADTKHRFCLRAGNDRLLEADLATTAKSPEYHVTNAGTVQLAAGRHTLCLEPAGGDSTELTAPLMKLLWIELQPVTLTTNP